MSDKLPNFLIVGAAKSGTTSLYHYLTQHPDIFMSPVKEPLFLSAQGTEESRLEKEFFPVPLDRITRDFGEYRELFTAAVHESALGESSVYYLYDYEKTIANIKRYIPDWKNLKILMILRNPVDASFSHYMMYSQYMTHFLGMKDIPSFAESFRLEEERIRDGYVALAHFHWFFYSRQVEAYLSSFDRVKILLQSDLITEPERVVREIFSFLSVDDTFAPSNTGDSFNVSGIPKSGFLYRFLAQESLAKKFLRPAVRLLFPGDGYKKLVNRAWSKNLSKPEMSPEMRVRLAGYYRDDILKLQDLIGRDLGHWLST